MRDATGWNWTPFWVRFHGRHQHFQIKSAMRMTPMAADPAAIPAIAAVLKPPLSSLFAKLEVDAVLVAALAVVLEESLSGFRNDCRLFWRGDKTAGNSLLLGQPSPQGLTSQHPMKGGSMFWHLYQTFAPRESSQLCVSRSSDLLAAKLEVRRLACGQMPLLSAQGWLVQHPMNSLSLPSHM